jgi:hypothetical protein
MLKVADRLLAKNAISDFLVSAAIFLSSEDGPVTPAGVKGTAERDFVPKKKQEDLRLATATTLAADVYATLPLELRMAALCLSMSENLARAKIGVAA